eukprot:TRINITY_DN32517_c0_g1_i1.p2 TRINITY_DN32517_c0_g1~~TRINITY_DN32517_c0_g1_i1.p2  ORF type:complete len:196 (+),score=62.41 TRINITY_DN32517_c0_g1_i1:65-589(+)
MAVPAYVDHGRLDLSEWAPESEAGSLGPILAIAAAVVVALVCLVACIRNERSVLKKERKLRDGGEPEEEFEEEPVVQVVSGRPAAAHRDATPAAQSASERPLLPAGEQHGSAQAAHSEPPPEEAQMYEVRQDPANSNFYPLASFIECYGEEEGAMIWNENAATAQYSTVPFDEL